MSEKRALKVVLFFPEFPAMPELSADELPEIFPESRKRRRDHFPVGELGIVMFHEFGPLLSGADPSSAGGGATFAITSEFAMRLWRLSQADESSPKTKTVAAARPNSHSIKETARR